MVRRFNIPDQEVQEAGPSIRPPRRLNIPDSVALVEPPVVERKARVLNVPDTAPAALQLAPVERKPRTLSVPEAPAAPVRAPRQRTQVDDLIDVCKSIDPTIDGMRVRARITALLRMDLEGILDWGEVNMAPLRIASQTQSEIAARMAQIDASGWLKQTMEASCKKPSAFDFLSSPKKPEYYEAMLNKTRAELMSLVSTITNTGNNYAPEIDDLNLDGVTLMSVAPSIQDVSTQSVAENRARSILAAKQTGVMLLQTIEQTKMQCAQFIQQIDNLLTVTLPNWKMAN